MIELSNVSFIYQNGTKALKDINLTMKERRFIGIIGPNGSGKSTLIQLLNGILLPTKGNVCVDGIYTTDNKSLGEIRKNVGVIFSNPEDQIVTASVEEEIAFGLENLGIPHDEMLERISKALEMVALKGKEHTDPNYLSGGEKQKLVIGAVFAMEPKYIVLDEPTSMLDPYGRQQVTSMLPRLKEAGKTIILVTHHLEDLIKADEVVLMDEGKVVLQGSLKNIFSQEEELKRHSLFLPDLLRLQIDEEVKNYIHTDSFLTVEEMVDTICQYQ